jgi:type III secretory pathway lipoprotein EscJ
VARISARPLLNIALALALLPGCDAELYHALEERQANEAVVALREAGIAGEKSQDGRVSSGQAPLFTLIVPRSEETRALRLLAEEGLPRPRQKGPARGAGLLPLPEELNDTRAQALEEQLSATLERLPQVSEARVHLALPLVDPLPLPLPPEDPRSRQRGARPQAAVLLRLRAGSASPGPGPGSAEVAQLVARAVPGLSPAEVSVMVAPAPNRAAADPASVAGRGLVRVGPLLVAPSSERWASALIALCLLGPAALLLTLGWARLRRRAAL